jgi:hypothetical protein
VKYTLRFSKVTALLRPLKDNGSVERTEEKRKVYFTRLA